MAYLLPGAQAGAAEVADRLGALAAADVVAHRDGDWLAVGRGEGGLRFRRGSGTVDESAGNGWDVEGDAGLLDAVLYPNALERIEGALLCATAGGSVIVSAAPGWEFADSGGIHHLGGGSHGSLRAEDSLVPLVVRGSRPGEAFPAAYHGRPAVRLPPLRRSTCEPTARPRGHGRIASTPMWTHPTPKPRRPSCGATRSASG